MAAVNIMHTTGLTKTYAGIKANTDVDFELAQGKITALIGPNGAGKSTFGGRGAGRSEATRGSVFFDGRDSSKLLAHKRIQLGIAYTFQITSSFTGLSLQENVALAARRTRRGEERAVRAKVAQVLDRVGLADRADQIAGDQSYGHQRLLEIAMGLAQDPKVFILDEPTQGLAESEVQDFIQLMKSLAGEVTNPRNEHNMTGVMAKEDTIKGVEPGVGFADVSPDENHHKLAH